MDALKKWIATRIQSKKFTVWLATIIVTLAHDKLGFALSPEAIQQILMWVTGIYLGSQGLADFGSKGATSGVTGNDK